MSRAVAGLLWWWNWKGREGGANCRTGPSGSCTIFLPGLKSKIIEKTEKNAITVLLVDESDEDNKMMRPDKELARVS